ncbi:MAG: DUF4870 domain-containing protein [Aquaticitalea sp.]
MSDNKNLGDDLDDMLDDAKTSSNDFGNEARHKANEFSEDTRRGANNFENDVNKVMSDGKNIALIAHITLIGWIIALVMNNEKKNEFASFYIRQMLGLMICAFILSFIPFIGWILNLGILVLWILSLIGAVNGEKKLVPGIGIYFQDWFKSL